VAETCVSSKVSNLKMAYVEEAETCISSD